MKNVLLLLSAALLIVAGCKTEPADLKPEANPYLSQTRVQYESHTTDHIVSVVREPDTERVGAGLLKVTLTLRDKTKENLFVEIRTTFLDAKGHVLENIPGKTLYFHRNHGAKISTVFAQQQAILQLWTN